MYTCKSICYVFSIIIAIFSLYGCTDNQPQRLPVEESSEYLGKTYTSKQKLIYVKNIPHHSDEVSDDYRRNGSLLLAQEANYKIFELRNDLPIHHDYVLSEFRAQIIPIGTEFKVVDEYRHHHKEFGLLVEPFEIHMLILEDEHGNVSEMSELDFELDILVKNADEEYLSYLKESHQQFLKNVKTIEQTGSVELYYMPVKYKNIEIARGDLESFFSYFDFEDTIEAITLNNYCQFDRTEKYSDGTMAISSTNFINWSDDSCEEYFYSGSDLTGWKVAKKIIFTSVEAYVTSYVFFEPFGSRLNIERIMSDVSKSSTEDN